MHPVENTAGTSVVSTQCMCAALNLRPATPSPKVRPSTSSESLSVNPNRKSVRVPPPKVCPCNPHLKSVNVSPLKVCLCTPIKNQSVYPHQKSVRVSPPKFSLCTLTESLSVYRINDDEMVGMFHRVGHTLRSPTVIPAWQRP